MTTNEIRDLHFDASRFLHREANLLDDQRFDEWLELLTDDIRYWIPTIESTPLSPSTYPTDDLHFGYMDEDKEMLKARVQQLNTGIHYVESPASRTTRFVSNLFVEPLANGEMKVLSNAIIFQVRHGHHESEFICRRTDRLRAVDGSLRLAERTVCLLKPILPRTLSIFI